MPAPTKRIIGDDVARFWSKVEKTDGCWLWRGGTFADGRPQFSVGRKPKLGHRWLYEQTVGPIPPGREIFAACGNSGCVRLGSGHRTLMTTAQRTQSVADRNKRSRCGRGHEFTAENTRVRVNGSRLCRACQRDRDAARPGSLLPKVRGR